MNNLNSLIKHIPDSEDSHTLTCIRKSFPSNVPKLFLLIEENEGIPSTPHCFRMKITNFTTASLFKKKNTLKYILHESLLGNVAKVNCSSWRCFSFLNAFLMSAFIESVLVLTSRIHLPQNSPGLLGHIRVSAHENLASEERVFQCLPFFFLNTSDLYKVSESNEQFSLMQASLFF